MEMGEGPTQGSGKGRASPVDWAAAYHELLPKVYHFFCFRIGDPLVAEDLAGTTFEKAWKHRGRYKEELGRFSSWLFGIARNEAASYLRRERPAEALGDELVDLGDPSPEDLVQAASDFSRLRVLLGEVSERERELLGLKYGAELTNRAIGELTGLSESNVGTILHRVVDRLRRKWEEGT